ncbi:putative uncharacterized protein DDB_G0282133 [Spodoptera frugiperda]|uniref:Peptidase A2 domain-containing protein n=1 Tax=Spodoptera frugiperda TaxID=7108 RepID=A0A9R0DRB0_SPOFR|nr:putative uncharacterized protein DDB_G0282133 [Spodoptera frugiperda]
MSTEDVGDTRCRVAGLECLKLSSEATANNAEAWRKWWQRLELYLLASGLDRSEEKRKVAILLHSIGPKGLEIFNTFNISLDEAKIEDVKVKFDLYFEPRKNLTMCRYMFFTRRQAQSESIDDFITDLEIKSQDCEFGTLRESMIRDIFIANLHMDLSHIRQRLLQEPNLTYERMRELAKTLIVAQQDADKMTNKSIVEDGEKVMQLRQRSGGRRVCRQRASSQTPHRATWKSPSPMRQSASTCGRCGQSHRTKCPAIGVQCRSCNSFGHYAKFCYKNKQVRQLHSSTSTKSIQNDKYFVGILNSQSSHNHLSHSHKQSHSQPQTQSYSQPQKQSKSQSYSQTPVKSHSHTSQTSQICLNKNSPSLGNLHDDNAYCTERLHRHNKNSLTSQSLNKNSPISQISRNKNSQSEHHYHCYTNKSPSVSRKTINNNKNSHSLGQGHVNYNKSNKNSQSVNKSHNTHFQNIHHHKYTKKSHHCQSNVSNTASETNNHNMHSNIPNVASHLNNLNQQISHVKGNSVSENHHTGSSWKINLHVGNRKINCVIDSGADVNVISVKNLNLSKSQIDKCHVNVTGFGGNNIPILGKVNLKCNLNIENRNICENIVFIVANILCPTVLGLPTCEKLGSWMSTPSLSSETQAWCSSVY